MSSEENFPQHGIIVPRDLDSFDHMNSMAHAILDDVFYNLIHDIVIKTHRQEKMQRANTAGIIVEQLAAELSEEEVVEPTSPATPRKKRKLVHTKGAVYDDGNVYIVGNPLETTKQIRCAQCGLPRIVFPHFGAAGEEPDPSIEYCQRKPFIDIPGRDVYNQPTATTRVQPSVKKKKIPDIPMEKRTKLVLPLIECPDCKQKFTVDILAPHLYRCREYGGRASGRAAALKINEQQTGSRQGSTQLLSRKSTPLPPEKKIPQKRNLEESGNSDTDQPKKKAAKKPAAKKPAAKKPAAEKPAAEKPAAEKPAAKKPAAKKGVPKKEETKKWKSGKVTVNGKTVATGRVPSSQSRGVSESSQTLSSP